MIWIYPTVGVSSHRYIFTKVQRKIKEIPLAGGYERPYLLIWSVIVCCMLFRGGDLRAETGSYVYEFLGLPTSVTAAGLGGTVVSSPETDLALVFHNPAVLSSDLHNTISIGYMNYVGDVNMGQAAYSRKVNDRSAWMTAIRYVDYGKITGADIYGTTTGRLAVKDMDITGGYSYQLGEHWRGGVTGHFIYSHLDSYTSLGVAFDLGILYANPDKLLWAGLSFKSLGAQFKSYDDTREPLPWDIQLGITKQLTHAPLRFTLTAWGFNSMRYAYYSTDESAKTDDDSFLEAVAKHLLIGMDILAGKNLLFNIGFNPRRRMELSTAQRSLLSGFCAGFSFKVKSMRFGASFAKYHISGNSLQLTAAIQLQ